MRLFEGTQWDIPPRCEHCNQLEKECKCPPHVKSRLPPDKQSATLRLEKRAKGKMVTVVRGLTAAANDLPALLTRLKNSCGAGGCVEGDTLEIQGDHVARAAKVLREIGYRVRET